MHRIIAVALVAASAAGAAGQARAQSFHEGMRRVAPRGIADLRQEDARIDGMLRSGELRTERTTPDFAIPGRTHERAAQYYKGIPVYGADVTRQLDEGQTVSVFGVLYDGIDLDVTPRLTREQAAALLRDLTGRAPGESRAPQLTVLPLDDGGYALTWRARVASPRGLTLYFIDAHGGRVVKRISDLKSQTAIGLGNGVLGDSKKMSVQPSAGTFVASDPLRPPEIITFDMKGDVNRTIDFLNGEIALGLGDIASDTDNVWGDGPAVDAHAYAGWTYDYFFKRFNRLGLDNNNIRILSLVHPVRRADLFSYSDDIIDLFFLNAAYFGDGVMVYGEGLPPGYVVSTGQVVDYFAGALDIIAHELTHGVTDYSSRLIYEGEPGALNEAFSDIMATGAEFFLQRAGTGPRTADYTIGEDTIRPGGIRSLSDPAAFGDPDHYSKRYTGTGDNGGVHTNSGIANHAFFLAIEGGANRTSGVAVAGVGGANREQIEKIFYRAFTSMLPASANFATARAATIQAARDLYGSGSPAERAVTQAWSAVGVN
jgi:thermolysin